MSRITARTDDGRAYIPLEHDIHVEFEEACEERYSKIQMAIEKLAKYEDEKEQSLNREDEVWKLARKISLPERLGGFSIGELKEIFDTDSCPLIYAENSYDEAVARIKKWEGKK